MDWSKQSARYRAFLRLEKSLSGNSVDAYLADLDKLMAFLETSGHDIPPELITHAHLQEFLIWIGELGMSPRSQARIVSGIKSFFRYLSMESQITHDPSELLESPRPGRRLPVILHVDEIDRILGAIDLSRQEGRASSPPFPWEPGI